MTELEKDNGNVLIHRFMGHEVKSILGQGEEHLVHKVVKLKEDVDIPMDWDLLNLTKEQKTQITEEHWYNINHSFEGLRYHGDWNWLMPVVEKIEKKNYGFKICRKVVEIYIDDSKETIIHVKEESKSQSLFKAIVEFLSLEGIKSEFNN